MGQNWGLISNIFFIFYFSFFIFSFSILFYKMFEISPQFWPIGPGVPERSKRLRRGGPQKNKGRRAPAAHSRRILKFYEILDAGADGMRVFIAKIKYIVISIIV